MDKKKKMIAIIALLVVVLGAAALFISGLTPSVGYVIEAGDKYLIVLQDSPVVMGNRTNNEKLFNGLRTGNQVLILHDGIAESYPGQTGVYFCLNLASGSPDKIPAHIIDSLTELGWLTP